MFLTIICQHKSDPVPSSPLFDESLPVGLVSTYQQETDVKVVRSATTSEPKYQPVWDPGGQGCSLASTRLTCKQENRKESPVVSIPERPVLFSSVLEPSGRGVG